MDKIDSEVDEDLIKRVTLRNIHLRTLCEQLQEENDRLRLVAKEANKLITLLNHEKIKSLLGLVRTTD